MSIKETLPMTIALSSSGPPSVLYVFIALSWASLKKCHFYPSFHFFSILHFSSSLWYHNNKTCNNHFQSSLAPLKHSPRSTRLPFFSTTLFPLQIRESPSTTCSSSSAPALPHNKSRELTGAEDCLFLKKLFCRRDKEKKAKRTL